MLLPLDTWPRYLSALRRLTKGRRKKERRRTVRLDVERGKGRPALPQAPAVPETPAEDEPPYAHPYYWAAFVLIGDKD
jgi:CHAT domain-containing protein